MPDALMLARKIVQIEKGLARLPKPENREANELAKLPVAELEARLMSRCNLPVLTTAENFVFGQEESEWGETPPADVAEGNGIAMMTVGDQVIFKEVPSVTATPFDAVDHSSMVRRRAAPTPIVKKRPFGRIIRTIVRDGVEYALHATKGWRRSRASL